MPKFKEQGAIQFVVLILLLAGIGAGVYLTKSGNLKLFSKASNPPIVFQSSNGQALPTNSSGISQTASPDIKIELTSTLGSPVFASPTPTPIKTPSSSLAPSSSPIGVGTSARTLGAVTSAPVQISGTVSYKIAENPTDLDKASYQSYTTEPTVMDYTFRDSNPGQKFIWAEFKDVAGKTDRRSAQINLVNSTGQAVENSFDRSNNSTTLGPGELIPIRNGKISESSSISKLSISSEPYRNWEKVTTVSTPAGRNSSSLAFFPPTGKLILYGGWGGWDKGQFGDTWEFDGLNWRQLNQSEIGTPVSPLNGHVMVSDEKNQRIVLFGGLYVDGLNQIWDRNDTYFFKINDFWHRPMWEPVVTTTKPPARQGHAMVYDSTRDRVLVFGGAQTVSRILLNDTWEFDGKDWKQIQTATAPSGRYHPVMSYDLKRKKVVLHGGFNWDSNRYGHNLTDTWEYDSNQQTWQKIADKAVDADSNGAMAYDLSISRVVLFGGVSSQRTDLDKTWEYNGSQWQEMFPASHPLSLDKPSMTYYPNMGKLVLFGGAYWDKKKQKWTYPNETWVYNTALSPTPTPTPSPLITPTPAPKVCKIGVDSFSVGTSCGSNKFKFAKYVCYDGFNGVVGGKSTDCKTSNEWRALAKQACVGRSSCLKYSPTPKY